MIDWYFQEVAELPKNQSAMSDTKITAISNTHLRGLHVAVNSHEHQHATMHVTSAHCSMNNYKPEKVVVVKLGMHILYRDSNDGNLFLLYNSIAQHDDVCRNSGRAPHTLNV